MVPVTRSDVNALEHILTILLGEAVPFAASEDLTPFRSCFTTAGVTNASDFVSIDPSAYGAILFPTTKGGTPDKQLNVIQVKKLVSLLSWLSAQPSPGVSTWFNLDFAGFQNHRVHLIPLPLASPTPSNTLSAVDVFRKGVRRNISDFKPFKEDRYWYSWQRHLLTTARSQNIEKVFDLSYTATNPSNVALLEEQ